MKFKSIDDLLDVVLGILDLPTPQVYAIVGKVKLLRGNNPNEYSNDLCQILDKTPFNYYKVYEELPDGYQNLDYNFTLGIKLFLKNQKISLFIFDRVRKTLSKGQLKAIQQLVLANHDESPANMSGEIIKKYQEGLKVLNEINSFPTTRFDQKLREGLKLCTRYLGMEIGIISEIEGESYSVLSYYPDESGLEEGQEFSLESTYCDITVNAKRPIAIDEMSTSEYSGHPCFQSFNLESYIGATYKANNTSGTINFSSVKPREEKFTSFELEFIELIAKWVTNILNQQFAQKILEAEQNILKSFVESAPAAIAMFDTEMRYLAASQKWIVDYNINRNVLGISHYEIFPEIGDDWKAIHNRVLAGNIDKNDEAKFERSDGTFQYIKWDVRPWYNMYNSIGGIIMFTDDITALVQQREQLYNAKIATEKAASIKERFAYIASHDLQEPVRTIISLSRMVNEEYYDRLDDSGKQMLSFINDSGKRMSTLIKGLLDYSRLGTDKRIEEVNINALLSEIEIDLANKIETYNAQLVYDDLPIITGFSVELRSLFQNLISNAIKFSRKDVKPVIEIKVSEDINGWKFSVSDNGIGIEPKFKDKIFQIFHRINSKESYEGTGIGLAHCFRIVEIHGGTIWVDSRLGEGSTFYFTINKVLN